jgi:maltose O-acetyltransferase
MKRDIPHTGGRFLRLVKACIPSPARNILFRKNAHPLCARFPNALIPRPDSVSIGERTSLGPYVSLFADDTIEIGHDTMIGSQTIITTATHSYTNNPMWKEKICRPVRIGSHVWIGTGVIILPGVRIEDYSVIGAGTVITRHVPRAAVVAGSPARILRYRAVPGHDSACEYPGVAVHMGLLPDECITKEHPSCGKP